MGASVLSGTVTLLLADLEGSVPHWEADPDAMTAAMDRVDVIVAATAGHHGGHLPLEQGEGDSFVVAFTNGAAAVACAIDLQRAFADEAWPGDRELEFRMGVHTGEVEARSGGRYVGTCVNRSARLRDLGHGGQTLVSGATRALVRDQLPTGAMLRYLGECELRGTAEPIEVYELTADGLRSDFPPLDVVSYVPLPATLTTFVGRSGERDEVRAQLADHRLVTVTGAGGSGKTRLALEVAAALPNALWADLAPLRRADLVVNTVADAIGISGNPDDLEAEIVRRIRSGAILLVLDNCEHLLDESARLAAALLERCPDLTVLATSREPLGIAGEAAFRIPSLRPAEASALFVDRAQLSQPGFELTPGNAGAIATICARLDGLPLAIELAASRTSTMGLDLIVDGLQERFRLLTGGSRDALPRQRTLEASVSWSYDLLGDAERTVFARLSVFAGSFDADAAAAVCAANGLARADVVDNLASLVDRSLVQVVRDGNTVRYRMLETIHVYARQRLRETDDPDATRERHLAWAKQLAVEGGLGFVLQTETWHPRLVAELDNLRAAISWALDQGRGDDAVEVMEPLVPFFPSSRMYPELDPLLRAALDAPRLSPEARLRALTVATGVAMYAGDFARGYELASEWVERGADHDDPDLVVMAHCMRAWTAAYALRGSNDQIRADLDLARAAVDSVQSPERRAELLMYIGSTEMSYESARVGRETLNRAIEVASTATGFTTATIGGRGYLIACAFDGKVEESLARADETVTMAHATGSDLLTAYALWSAGLVYTLVGREDEARRHITASFEAARRSRLELQVHFAQRTDAVFQLRFGEPEDALEAALAAQASARRWPGSFEAMGCAWVVGAAARRAGRTEVARATLEEVDEGTRDPSSVLISPLAAIELALLDVDEDDVDAAWERAHDALGVAAGSHQHVTVLDALDLIAELHAGASGETSAARILGGTERWRSDFGFLPFALEPGRRAQTIARVRDALGSEFDTEWDAGAALDIDALVALVRRGRGRRGRPASGWASLTPAEREVVQLVAKGLSNPAIADRLFVSTNTVKTHLAHVYAKLGTSSRAEVAAEAVRHGA